MIIFPEIETSSYPAQTISANSNGSSTLVQNQSFSLQLNCCWFSALILLQEEFLSTRAPLAKKLTVWLNCSLYTETSKAKWIQFGCQSLSKQLHFSENESQVNTFWLAILDWNVVFKWKCPYTAQFRRQIPAKFFCSWCICVEIGRPSEYNLPGIVWFNYLI